jgi:hypothetical protein
MHARGEEQDENLKTKQDGFTVYCALINQTFSSFSTKIAEREEKNKTICFVELKLHNKYFKGEMGNMLDGLRGCVFDGS